MENKFLFNDNIIVRFISLFVIGAILHSGMAPELSLFTRRYYAR